ncbi:MAG: sugar isomerase domain-containing protein [Candidatus Bipolaricaulia bacterium]
MLSEDYYDQIVNLTERIRKTQREAMLESASLIAESLSKGHVLHAFGSGHSYMIVKEVVGRAGGLVPVNGVYDPTEGVAERIAGYAAPLLKRYESRFGLRQGEVMIIISNSGRNPLPIEMALEAQARGLSTIGITSLAYSQSSSSRHASGKRLYEIVDIVLDNCGEIGDALVEIKELGQRAGPGSTIGGALLINMVMLETIERLIETGHTPPVLKSANLDGADEFNQKLMEQYRGRLSWL